MRQNFYITGSFVAIFLFGSWQFPAFAAPEEQRISAMRRLSESEYRNSIADIFGSEIEVQGRFETDRRVGGLLAASSAILSITRAGFEGYTKIANSISAQVVDAKHRAKLIPCSPQSAAEPDDLCASQALRKYGLALFRRPLTADELKTRVKLANALAKSSGDFYSGLRYAISSMLTAPDFLFRVEVAVPDDSGGWTLDGYSRAARLSFLLWDTTPDAVLLDAARSGALSNATVVNQQVERLLASPRLITGMKAFYSDFLELDSIGGVTKDTTIYPKYADVVAASAKEETLRTMITLTLNEKGDLRDLLTTRKTYINRVLAAIYEVPYNFDTEWVPYEFSPASGRSGVLTQASFLSMFSHPGRSSPTKRGVALNDIFMCAPTPAPPANVNFDIINDTNNPKLRTVRQRLMAHATSPACASCHTHNDPIGLALEGFDSIGAFRTTEGGMPVDASATLQGKSFSGGAGLGQFLHDNPRFPACFTRKLYAYGVGADTFKVPASLTRSSLDIFAKGGYRVPVLLKALATSREFMAAPPPPDTKTAINVTTK
jgi:Protein of unknown function (DUF1592)/Protein of unknown function (DUF1588)/Protein of unknown function (DUF1595)/Protein of unknown function (DUF1587)/Protein of unknown function (DUF1585)